MLLCFTGVNLIRLLTYCWSQMTTKHHKPLSVLHCSCSYTLNEMADNPRKECKIIWCHLLRYYWKSKSTLLPNQIDSVANHHPPLQLSLCLNVVNNESIIIPRNVIGKRFANVVQVVFFLPASVLVFWKHFTIASTGILCNFCCVIENRGLLSFSITQPEASDWPAMTWCIEFYLLSQFVRLFLYFWSVILLSTLCF